MLGAGTSLRLKWNSASACLSIQDITKLIGFWGYLIIPREGLLAVFVYAYIPREEQKEERDQ
jgi:hypothetical protein